MRIGCRQAFYGQSQEAQCEISDTEGDYLQAVEPWQTGIAVEVTSQFTTTQRQATESESEPEDRG